MADPVTIDGAAGGGQVLRNAVALAAVCGRPVRVANIRGARPQPGLRPQHVTAIRAVAEVCGASLTGAEIGSREIEFRPAEVSARTGWRLDVGTAGSLTLVLQCLLPALAHADRESELTLVGGTDVPFAPPADYFRQVFAPALARLGPAVESRVMARGFYPKGGGELRVRVCPAPVRPVRWVERGPVVAVRGICFSQGLPEHIVARMREGARRALEGLPVEIEAEARTRGASEGCGIVLWAQCERAPAPLGASALGRRGTPAERVGENVARSLQQELSGGAVDSHLADQMIVWLALASGDSEFTTSRASDHLRSAAAVARVVTGAQVEIGEGAPVRVHVRPGGG